MSDKEAYIPKLFRKLVCEEVCIECDKNIMLSDNLRESPIQNMLPVIRDKA